MRPSSSRPPAPRGNQLFAYTFGSGQTVQSANGRSDRRLGRHRRPSGRVERSQLRRRQQRDRRAHLCLPAPPGSQGRGGVGHPSRVSLRCRGRPSPGRREGPGPPARTSTGTSPSRARAWTSTAQPTGASGTLVESAIASVIGDSTWTYSLSRFVPGLGAAHRGGWSGRGELHDGPGRDATLADRQRCLAAFARQQQGGVHERRDRATRSSPPEIREQVDAAGDFPDRRPHLCRVLPADPRGRRHHLGGGGPRPTRARTSRCFWRTPARLPGSWRPSRRPRTGSPSVIDGVLRLFQWQTR